jgi:hypothetical protein
MRVYTINNRYVSTCYQIMSFQVLCKATRQWTFCMDVRTESRKLTLLRYCENLYPQRAWSYADENVLGGGCFERCPGGGVNSRARG